MDRPTIIATAAAVITVAVGAFALSRAIATDEPASVPAPVTTVAPATAGSAPPPASGATEAPAGSSATAPVAIEIADFSFSPSEVTVAAGTEVVWTNNDNTKHSILSADQLFVSPTLEQGDTYSFTFTTPGEYRYICGFHNSMTGTITVTA